jgi:hypothetical protein
MRRGTHAKGRINNQFLITGFSILCQGSALAQAKFLEAFSVIENFFVSWLFVCW